MLSSCPKLTWLSTPLVYEINLCLINIIPLKFIAWPGTYTKFIATGHKQVDYLLGDNPMKMSYMVGYGPRYPQRIHHRGSSLPSIASHPFKIQCTAGFSVMKSQSPNPNVLIGAVVGGPDRRDRFLDQRSDYFQSEPATYINAPLVGSLAYLAHSFGQL